MHRYGVFPILVFVLSCTALAGGSDLDAQSREFDQLHVVLAVEPDVMAGTVTGEVKIRFASLVPELAALKLHSLDTQVLAATDSAGRTLVFTHDDGLLEIALAAPLPAGAEETVAVKYVATPKRGLWFHRPTEEHPHVPLSFYVQGQGEENRHWFPCYDRPDDRFTFELLLTVPDELRTVANGLKVTEKYLPGPRRMDHWVLDSRLPSYLVTMTAGPIEQWVEEVDGVLLEINSLPERLEEAKTAFGCARDMIPFFGKYLGTPYPYDRYAQTTVWDFLYGGMENTTATMMNMRLLHTEAARPNFTADGIVAHELAHQWFGDYITCRDWRHIWLNEGFATYLTDLWFEHAEGGDEFRLRRRAQTREYFEQAENPGHRSAELPAREDIPVNLSGGWAYTRGAAILHMLRYEVGDLVFQSALRRYLKTRGDGTAVSEDLRRVFEKEVGRDLGWFFDQWVYGGGYPRISTEWRHEPAEGQVVLTVTQEPGPAPSLSAYRFTLPIRLETPDGGATVRLAVRARREEFRLDAPSAPRWVSVDHGGWLLARIETKQPLEAHAARAREDGDVAGRLAALEALLKMGEEGVEVIADAAENDVFYGVRREAVKFLARRPDSMAAQISIMKARLDDDPRVREAAFEALGELTRNVAGAAAEQGVLEEEHPYVRAAAAKALGRMHTVSGFELLAELLAVPSHREVVRQGAIEGLTSLGDQRAVGMILPFLDYRWGLGAMSRMRHSALDLVTKLAPEQRRTREAVIRLLDDPYFRMRGWAAEACGKYGYREARARLARMKEEDADWGAREAARVALERLGGDPE